MEEQRIDPAATEPPIARRPERVGGWWDRNQDFIRRRADSRRMRPAAAQAERGTEPAAIFSMEEEQRIDPAIARRGGDRGSSRPDEQVGGWRARNQDFIRRRAEARTRPAAAQSAEAERGTEPAAIFSLEEEQRTDPAIARRGGDRESSRPGERAGGWRARNEDFIRRRAATLAMRPAAQAAAEAECGREPASKKSMAALPVPAAGEVRELSCAVCLDDLVAGGGRKLRTMPCSHSFHQRCLFEWLHVNRHCPMCRFAMPSRPAGELVGGDVERELAAEEEDAAVDDDAKFAATEECSSSGSSKGRHLHRSTTTILLSPHVRAILALLLATSMDRAKGCDLHVKKLQLERPDATTADRKVSIEEGKS